VSAASPRLVSRRSPRTAAWNFADGKLLLDLASDEYSGLGRTDAVLWDLVDGERALAELGRASDAPETDVERDVVGRLEVLRQRGLIVE
jgi:coenzyme PQQ synthesis protein D (PqqD)